MQPIDTDATKYHGATYDEAIDRDRFTAQLLRLYDVLQSGQWFTAPALCERAEVSYSALRNRISDLRVYHGAKVEAERIEDGLWRYRFTGMMTPQEHQTYLVALKTKRPIGDAELWGKMWRAIYAYAHQPDIINAINLKKTAEDWARNMSHKVYVESM